MNGDEHELANVLRRTETSDHELGAIFDFDFLCDDDELCVCF